MGEFARTLQREIRDGLDDRMPGVGWHEEYDVAGTPVDVVGVVDGESGDAPTDEGASAFVAVELEVRRADPANNTVKLLRALEAGVLDRFDRVVVCQVFSTYYDLVAGGVSTKRENAAFVGGLAERADDRVTYHEVTLPVDPPRRGADPPGDWRDGVERAVERVRDALASA